LKITIHKTGILYDLCIICELILEKKHSKKATQLLKDWLLITLIIKNK